MILIAPATVRASVTFTALDGTAFDPQVVTFRYKMPDGTEVVKVYGTDSELVREQSGAYHIDVHFTTAGSYRWRWEGDGTAKTTIEGRELVRASLFDA